MVRRRGYSPEQIITKLREAEVLLSQGKTVAQACKAIEVSEQTYYRWRKEYGGMTVSQAKQLKEMEKENARDIAAGKRCFKGAIGSHALNIGKTYAIHGTRNTASLGKKVSHGCVRTENQKMAKIYDLMDVGDKVYIVD